MAFEKTLNYTINDTLKSRIIEENYHKALVQQEISPENYKIIKYLAEFAARPLFRTPVHKTPADHGMEKWEDVYF